MKVAYVQDIEQEMCLVFTYLGITGEPGKCSAISVSTFNISISIATL